MPFTSGSVSCVVYRVAESLPEDFKEKAQKGLKRYAFQPINPARNEDRAAGWVNPLDLLSTDLRLDRQLLGDYLYLGVRIDKKSPNRAVLAARVQTAVAERLKDGQRKRLGADERRAIQAEARNKLLAETSASTAVYEALWNVEAGWLFFSSHGPTANNEFLDLFASTFELEITPMLPYTYAEQWAESNGLSGALESLEEGVFCRRKRLAAAPELVGPVSAAASGVAVSTARTAHVDRTASAARTARGGREGR